jgi:hypothetical protein
MSVQAQRRRGRERVSPREQRESVFAAILADLVSRLPGARGAVLVDAEGEAVDFSGRSEPFELQLAGAHWRVVLEEVHCRPALGAPIHLVVRAARASYLVRSLPDGYAVVVVFARAAGQSGWSRALLACAWALAAEAGWPSTAVLPALEWFPVRVDGGLRERPRRLWCYGVARSFETLGAVVSGLAPGERAWRVRLETGLEATLLRERGGAWYVDERPDVTGRGQPGSPRPARKEMV